MPMDNADIRITLVCENTATGAGLLGEHGLSWWIEAGGRRVLFDTGQGLSILHNAQRLGVDLSTTDAIVLSHGHYDHVGGLPAVLEQARDCPVWLHPAALDKKYSRGKDGRARRISCPLLDEEKLASIAPRLRWLTEPTEIVPGVFATGPVPRRTGFEDRGGDFFRDEAMQVVDPLVDDVALAIPALAGTVVVLGCAHAGVVNTLDQVAPWLGPVAVVMGGMHLLHADRPRLQATAEAIHRHGVRSLGPNHCTGEKALAFLRQEFPDQCFPCHVGMRWPFSPPHPPAVPDQSQTIIP